MTACAVKLRGPESDERYTPAGLFSLIGESLGYVTHDPCPRPNSLGGPEHDGLGATWPRNLPTYCNPPGSLALQFAQKFVSEGLQSGAFLIFNWDHSTRLVRTLLDGGCDIYLLRRRWKFEAPDGRMVDVGRCQAIAFKGRYARPTSDEFIGVITKL